MAELVPQSFGELLRRLAHELKHGAAFDLPARSFFAAPPDLDLSVSFHGSRAGNASGPAAGPQSQLAQNLVLSYLAGGRILELKTVQVNDQLVIPRPCIDATNVGFNVEWSQELRLTQSLEEYVRGWVLLHALRSAGLGLGLEGSAGEFLFDMSVGYDLKGIRSPTVRAFLDGMLDARSRIDRLFETWPEELRAWRPEREKVPNRVSECITLSTFHGCPADEIERICEFLLDEVGVHVVVKLNPTLLGYEGVRELLNGRLGYDELRPHEASFAGDLKWDDALGLVRRLQSKARAKGLIFGAKFSNTLVVENHKRFFPSSEKLMYMSGAPLHALSFELAKRFREAYGAELPISFSAGVDRTNFADCVASGLAPITTCTDLLKPGGYGRLPKYMDALADRMRKLGVDNVPDYVLAAEDGAWEAGLRKAGFEGASLAAALALPAKGRAAALGERREAVLHHVSLINHARAAERVAADPRYAAPKNRAVPRRLGTKLWFFDCVSCDKCVQVCPNDANFTLELPPEVLEGVKVRDLVVRNGGLEPGEERELKLKDRHQLANFADWCNECGNCDVFCPEEGGPYVVKPRFFSTRELMESAPDRLEGFYVAREGRALKIEGRHEGTRVKLIWGDPPGTLTFDDGSARVVISLPGFEVRSSAVHPGASEGHVVRMDRARALLAMLQGLVESGASNPINAPLLPAVAPDAAREGVATARIPASQRRPA